MWYSCFITSKPSTPLHYSVFSTHPIVHWIVFSSHMPVFNCLIIQYLVFLIQNSVPPQGACLFCSRHVVIQSDRISVEFRAVDVRPGMAIITDEEYQKCVEKSWMWLHVVGGVEDPRQGAQQQDSCAMCNVCTVWVVFFTNNTVDTKYVSKVKFSQKVLEPAKA